MVIDLDKSADPKWDDIPRPVPSLSYRAAYDMARCLRYLWFSVTRPHKAHRVIGMAVHESGRGMKDGFRNVADETAWMDLAAARRKLEKRLEAQIRLSKDRAKEDLGSPESYEQAPAF